MLGPSHHAYRTCLTLHTSQKAAYDTGTALPAAQASNADSALRVSAASTQITHVYLLDQPTAGPHLTSPPPPASCHSLCHNHTIATGRHATWPSHACLCTAPRILLHARNVHSA
jgi:hypothetical protein